LVEYDLGTGGRVILVRLWFLTLILFSHGFALAGEKVEGSWLLKIKPGLSQRDVSRVTQTLEKLGARITYDFTLVPGLVEVTSFAPDFRIQLSRMAAIQYVEPNYVRHIAIHRRAGAELSVDEDVTDPAIPVKPTPPLLFVKDPKSNYSISQNQTDKVFHQFRFYGDSKTVLAILDTGVDYTHRDLAANIWRNSGESGLDSNHQSKESNGIDDDHNGFIDDVVGYDFSNNDSLPFDDHSHGTHVAGLAAAVAGNGLDTIGHCGRCTIMPLKFMNAKGTGNDADAIRAVEYAIQNGAHILNNSWGSEDYSQALEDAFKLAAEKGLTVVSAAGNDGMDLGNVSLFPAKFKLAGGLTVAALVETDIHIPFWSNYSHVFVHLSSGGREIESTIPGNKLGLMTGTSMAAPNVAGCAGLIKSYNPKLTNIQIAQLFKAHVLADRDSMSKTAFQGRPNMLEIFKAIKKK
jgi:subtilisin family serine protease